MTNGLAAAQGSALIEKVGAVQWITLNRPERRNAINAELIAGVADGIRAAMEDEEILAIVLTGAGDKAFCAGGDLNPAADGTPFTIDHANPRHYIVDLFKLVEKCSLPIVARVNGHVLAGGMGLLCMCDMAVAGEGAMFGTPETKVGLFPATILPYMMRLMPRRKLLEMCITGEPFCAVEALQMGLVNHVVPDDELDAKLDWLLGRILDKSPTGIRLGKQGFHAMQDMALAESFEYSQLLLPTMAKTEDAREGMKAFAEKRAQNWTGR